MTDVFFDARLAGRDFGMQLLRVADLLSWARGKGLTIASTPALDGHEFAQIEALLCGIERKAREGLSPEMALAIVENDPVLLNDPVIARAPKDEGPDPSSCLWLIGASAHHRWRKLLEGAVQAGELQVLEFASKLPIAGAVLEPGPANDDDDGGGALKPVQRSAAQDAAVLSALKALGVDPQKVPRNSPGKPGIKSQVKDTLEGENKLFPSGGAAFRKAWERLRKSGDIKDA